MFTTYTALALGKLADDNVLTLYKSGSCEITRQRFETFGQERRCVIEQELAHTLHPRTPDVSLRNKTRSSWIAPKIYTSF